MSSPLKPLLSEYHKLEEAWLQAIYAAFGMDDWWEYGALSKQADEEMFRREVNWFFDKPEDFGVEPMDIRKPVFLRADEAEELMLYQLDKWASV